MNLGCIRGFLLQFGILGSFRQLWRRRGSGGWICPLGRRGNRGRTAGAGLQTYTYLHIYGNTQPHWLGLGWNVTCPATPPERQPFRLIRAYFDFLQRDQVTFLHRTTIIHRCLFKALFHHDSCSFTVISSFCFSSFLTKVCDWQTGTTPVTVINCWQYLVLLHYSTPPTIKDISEHTRKETQIITIITL